MRSTQPRGERDHRPGAPTKPRTDRSREDNEALEGSPPGTAAGRRTTSVDPSGGKPSHEQMTVGRRALRDAESEQQNTDRYDTSGQDEDPPKTPYHRPG